VRDRKEVIVSARDAKSTQLVLLPRIRTSLKVGYYLMNNSGMIKDTYVVKQSVSRLADTKCEKFIVLDPLKVSRLAETKCEKFIVLDPLKVSVV
jgi:hypothetical protein